MRRSILTLATLSVLSLGACASGGGDTTSSASSSSSSRATTSSISKSSPAPDPTPGKSKVAPPIETTTTAAPSADAVPEVVSEDGGTPGGGLADEEFTTKGYLEDAWAMAEAAGDGSAGMMCLIFRAEPDVEFGLGEDALIDSIDAEVVGIDREEARKFFDKKCPTADEIDAASQEGDQ